MTLPYLYGLSLTKTQPLHPSSISADMEITPPSVLTLTFAEDADRIPAVREWIRYDVKGDPAYWRVVEVERTVGEQYTVTCEHGIISLTDAACPAKVTLSGTLKEILTTLLGYQSPKRWQLGACPSVSGISVDYAFDEVLEAIVELCGTYVFSYDMSSYPWTLNVSATATKASCEARVSRNMTGATISVNDDELCTRVLCSDLTDGYLDADDDTIAKYGIVKKSYTRPGIRSATAECTTYLNEHKTPAYEISIDALLLSELTGESMDNFGLGKIVRVVLPDTTVSRRINSIQYEDLINAPNQATLTAGAFSKSTVSYTVQASKSGGGGGSGSSGNDSSNKTYTAKKFIATSSMRAPIMTATSMTASEGLMTDLRVTNELRVGSRVGYWRSITDSNGNTFYVLAAGAGD